MGRGDIRDLALIRLVHQKTKFLSHESKADVDHQTLSYLALLQDEQMEELRNQTKILLRLEEILQT